MILLNIAGSFSRGEHKTESFCVFREFCEKIDLDLSYRLILAIDKDYQLAVTDILLVHDLTNHYQ